MPYHASDESCGSTWTVQKGGSCGNSSGHRWDGQVSAGTAYQSFEGGPVSPQSTAYPPEWEYHAITPMIGNGYQAHDYTDLQLTPTEHETNVVGGEVSAISNTESGVVNPSTEYHDSEHGEYFTAYQPHNWSQAHQDVHAAGMNAQSMYILNSGSLPAQSEGHTATNSRCSTATSSASPQSSSHPDRQRTPPRGSGHAEYSIPCPYRCGTTLTGVHAVGNLKRHIKSQSCTASGKTKAKYSCRVNGCSREYARSDGLKVHMRRKHNAPAALPKNSPALDNGDED